MIVGVDIAIASVAIAIAIITSVIVSVAIASVAIAVASVAISCGAIPSDTYYSYQLVTYCSSIRRPSITAISSVGYLLQLHIAIATDIVAAVL